MRQLAMTLPERPTRTGGAAADGALRLLLATGLWGSSRCALTWRAATTRAGRPLHRLTVTRPSRPGSATVRLHTPAATANQLAPSMIVRDRGSYGHDLWPTPRATKSEMQTYKRTPSQEAGKHGKYLAVEAGQTQQLKLSAAWVSRMMGFPDGWTDVA